MRGEAQTPEFLDVSTAIEQREGGTEGGAREGERGGAPNAAGWKGITQFRKCRGSLYGLVGSIYSSSFEFRPGNWALDMGLRRRHVKRAHFGCDKIGNLLRGREAGDI